MAIELWATIKNDLYPAIARLAEQLKGPLFEALEASKPLLKAFGWVLENVILLALKQVVAELKTMAWLIDKVANSMPTIVRGGLGIGGTSTTSAPATPTPAGVSAQPQQTVATIVDRLRNSMAQATAAQSDKELQSFYNSLISDRAKLFMTEGQAAAYDAAQKWNLTSVEQQSVAAYIDATNARKQADDDYQTALKSINEYILQTRDAYAVLTGAMTDSEAAARAWARANGGATPAMIERFKQLHELESSMRKYNAQVDRAKQLTDQYATPVEKLIKTKSELDSLLQQNLISIDTYNRALEDAEKQAHKDYTVDFKAAGVDNVIAGSAEAMRRMEEYRDRAREMRGINPRVNRQPNGIAAQPQVIAQPLGRQGGGESKAEQYLARLVVLAEKHWSGNAIELSAADFN
jgi:hypothetical protein